MILCLPARLPCCYSMPLELRYTSTIPAIPYWVEVDPSAATVSSSNATAAPLGAGATFTGPAEDASGHASVAVAAKTDQAGTLYVEFSPDGTNWDSSLSFAVAAGTNEVHRLSVTRQFYRVRFTNTSGSPQTYLRIQSLLGAQPPLTSALNSTIQTDADSLVTRSVIIGQTVGGQFQNVPVTADGHLEVAIHGPRLPFGSIHTESMTPQYQTDAVYGLNSGQVTARASGSGTVTAVASEFVCTTGTTVASYGVLLGRNRLRYRPGQGVIVRYTGRYSDPGANSYQLIGVGHAEDGVYFGYGNTNDLTDTRFGIIYVKNGVRETRTLTVTVGAEEASDCTITLNTTSVFTVPLTAASNVQRTVYEIATYSGYTGWDAYAVGATVVFVRQSSGPASGTYSFAAGTTGAAATFTQTKAGVASTDTFIPQAEWNGDKLDGAGASGVLLDPTKGNVFQVHIQQLGYGALVFQVEVVTPTGNSVEFVTVHTIKNPNSVTGPIFGNPSFPFTMAAYSAGSVTDLAVRTASFAGFVEGPKMLRGNRFTYFRQLTTVNDTNLQALFTIMNTRYYSGRTNQLVINLLSVAGALKHGFPCIFYLVRGGVLTGNPNFQSLASNSCSVWDQAATTVTYSTGDQLLWTGHLGDTGDMDHHFSVGAELEEVTIQPGEWVTLAARAASGSPSYVTGSINTREDQ